MNSSYEVFLHFRYEKNYDMSGEEFYIYGIIWLYYFIVGFSSLIRPNETSVFILQAVTTAPALIGYAQEHIHDKDWINPYIKLISLAFTNAIYFQYHFGLIREQPYHPYVNAIYVLLGFFLAQAQTLYWFAPEGGMYPEQAVAMGILSVSFAIAYHVTQLLNPQLVRMDHIVMLRQLELDLEPVVDMSGDGSVNNDN